MHTTFIHIRNTYYIYTVFSVHGTLYIVQCTLYTVHCTLYIIHYILYSVHCITFTLQYALYSVQCTVYSVCYIYFVKVHWTEIISLNKLISILFYINEGVEYSRSRTLIPRCPRNPEFPGNTRITGTIDLQVSSVFRQHGFPGNLYVYV